MAAGMDGGKRRTDSYNENSYDRMEEDEPNFSDPEDFEDDIEDEELLPDLMKTKPKATDGIDSVIVVDNIPQVGPERLEKLQNVVRKLFSKFGNIVNEFYPEEDGKTKGYIFLEYTSPLHALEAVKMADGYKLDKQHTFKVNLFSDFDKYENVPDEWEPPEPKPYKDVGNLHYWLHDKDCRDPYSVIYEGGEKTAIYLNDVDPTLVAARARWTETYVRWSPKGTYLATFHQKGIALWGGEQFEQIMKFSHTGVQLIDFSPCEKYLVTFSPLQDSREDPQAIIVWDITTGLKRRGFHCETQGTWPIFKWNFDGAYLARIGQDAISIYETPSFGLLDKKSYKVQSVKDFSWSPTDNMIVYWVPENENVPARVTLIELPSRIELSVKNLFNVASCKMHWQKQGDLLCVKVDRYSKIRKVEDKQEQVKYSGIYYNFELFRIREKQIPIEKVEMKEVVHAFAWEPNGSKFAVIHGETGRISVSFYTLHRKGKVEHLKTLEKRTANHLFWSPTGQFVVLAGLRNMNGVLEFVDTADMTVMTQTEHFMATDIEWDPTGRYVISAVSWWGHKVDNAYWLWNFQGNLLAKQPLERFCQLLWRPRPTTLLTDKSMKEIRKNMKKFSVQFENEDITKKQSASKEMLEKRRALMDDYRQYRREREEEYELEKERRMELRDGVDTDELHSHEDNMEEEVIEFLIDAEETVLEE